MKHLWDSSGDIFHILYKKWLTELDRSHQTSSWLDCDTRLVEGKKVVTKLKRRICAKHKARINGRKHFSQKWIEGVESIRTSNIRDHANADQHIYAMKIEQRDKHKQKASHLSHYQALSLKRFQDRRTRT